MSYFGPLINVGDKSIKELINELKDILRKSKRPRKEAWIGHRVCDNECDSNFDPTCDCDTYSIVLKDKK